MNLSLNFYTQWYWKTDLHNLMHFLSLRADPHAQYEIRAYAEAMLGHASSAGSRMAHAAFLEYRMNAAHDLRDRPRRDPPHARGRDGRPGDRAASRRANGAS